MALGYLVALRNNQLDEIPALIDAGVGAGKLKIYDGVRPATGGTATTLLEIRVQMPLVQLRGLGLQTVQIHLF